MQPGVSFLLFVCLFFSCVLPKKGVIVSGRAFHKFLGNFLASVFRKYIVRLKFFREEGRVLGTELKALWL